MLEKSVLKRYMPKNPSDFAACCVLVAAIHAVFFFESSVVLPFVYRSHQSNVSHFIHVVLQVFIYVNVMGNMYKLIMTENGTKGMMLPITLKSGWRFCSGCECNSPPRSYHCFTCNKCVLKRDHHCSFTGNCVGFQTQRYYIHMLLWLAIGAVYSNCLNFDYAYHTLHGLSFKTLFLMVLPIMAWVFGVSETVTVGSAFLTSVCLIGLALSSVLLLYHMRNILRGQTTFENAKNITLYDLGREKNLIVSFGKNWKYCWLSPWISSPLPGNGLEFSSEELFEASKDI